MKHSIGIDLGTTNTSLAFAPLDDEKIAPASFSIEQVTNAGETAQQSSLPSFLYLPADVELPPGSLALPWQNKTEGQKRDFCVGAFARDRASSVPGRVVSSAKSWLCHPGVDRRGPILPVQAPDELTKLSPVDVSARILSHLVDAWDAAHSGKNDLALTAEDVVLTVPASFDAVARALTEEAAKAAGFTHLTLLEEPQAALYAWVAQNGDQWRKKVNVGDNILVVDVGGGTTDFSLIEVKDDGGNLGLSRVAVGDHILLGGDNMDLALAYRLKAKLEDEGKTLDDWQLRGLMHACRAAKETLLDPSSKKEKVPVAVASRGSKLVGGTIRTELTREEIDETLLDGFFPEVKADARPAVPKKAGLQTLGLPYAQDAAITRHLAAFLDGRKPKRLLFNGGVTKSKLLRERITNIVGKWCGGVDVLESADLDLAVSIGAAYYGRARAGKGLRIKGGASRAYYVGIERAEMAVPGVAPRVDAVCIAPLGMEEGTEVELPSELGLVVGEPATFRFFSSSHRPEDTVSAVVDPKKAELAELSPIETTLEGPSGAVMPVKLHARVTEVGTLELSAVESSSKKRHKLEFNIRVE